MNLIIMKIYINIMNEKKGIVFNIYRCMFKYGLCYEKYVDMSSCIYVMVRYIFIRRKYRYILIYVW